MGNIFIGDSNSKARKINNAYIGIDGIARQVKQIYVGDANGKARLVWSAHSNLFGSIAYVQARYLYLTTDYFANTTSYYNETFEMQYICFAKDRYFTTGSRGRISSFKDGVFTLLYSSPNSTSILGMAAHDNNIVCHSYNTVIISKDCGTTWIEQSMGIDDTNFLNGRYHCMIHDGTQFVCIKPSGNVYTSPTGEVWTKKSLAGSNYKYIYYANGKYFAADEGMSYIKYSTDLVNWQSCSNTLGSMWWPSGSSTTVYSFPQIDYINGVYTLVQAKTSNLPNGYSRDGIRWEYVSDYYPQAAYDFYSLNCGDRILIFSHSQSDSRAGTIWQTTDGINYTALRSNVTYYAYGYNIAFANK